MSDRIFAELARGWHQAEDLGHDVAERVAALHHHHDQQSYPETTTTPDTEDHPMNLTEIHDLIDEGVGNIEGWAANLRGKLPEIATRAQQLAASPIAQALEEIGAVILPPGTEQAIAGLIKAAAKDIGAIPAPEPVQAEPVTVAAADDSASAQPSAA